MFEHILIPLDGSELAEGVLPYAGYLAKRLSLEVIPQRVVRLGALVHAMADVVEGTPRDLTSPEVDLMGDAMRYLIDVAEKLQNKGIRVRYEVIRGAPGQKIAEFAHDTDEDMVAMSTYGRTGLGRLMMGSVADHVIRNSGDPVLVFRPPYHIK